MEKRGIHLEAATQYQRFGQRALWGHNHPSLSLKIADMTCTYMSAMDLGWLESRYLGHHASPGNNVRIHTLAQLLFMRSDSLQQAIKMVVCSIVELLEGVKTFRQIRS